MGIVHGILSALFPPRPEPIDGVVFGRQVTVRGAVIARDLLCSPLTATDCVYYNYSIEEWRESRMAGVPEGYWQLTEHDEVIAEFYLQDASARAIIAPQRARIERGRRIHPARLGLDGGFRRASELVIRPGDVVEVTGVAERADDLYDDARDYRQRPTSTIVLAPPTGQIRVRLLAHAGERPTRAANARASVSAATDP